MALMQIEHGSEKYQQMVALRDELLRRPLGLNFEPGELEREKEDMLIGAFEDSRILGCCILTEVAPDTVRLRQMAVSKKHQHKGIGHSIMVFAENLARDRGYKKITMHARDTAIGFYSKHGYKVSGDEFYEVTIPHHIMEKNLR
jgi:N-acetylglutamate synthase-like GNAT family acetyltransferase